MINLLKRKTGSASREDRLRRQDVQDKKSKCILLIMPLAILLILSFL